MSFTTRNAALLAAILLSATTMAGDIQQVAGKRAGCGKAGCGETCCNTNQSGCRPSRSQKKSKASACQSCQACQACNHCEACDSEAGKCSMRNRMDAFALDWTGKCTPIGRRAAKGGPLAQKMVWHCRTKGAPDSGWAPPATLPVTRTGGTYTAYNNFGRGGYAPAAPMVYQPTDTAQMGYSYANVPQWQANPGMIPPVPNPSSFHARFCPGQRLGTPGCQFGQCHMQPMGQEIYYESAPSSCPSCNLSSNASPVRQQVVAAPTPTANAAPPTRVANQKSFTPATIQMKQTSVRPNVPVRQVSQQQTVRPSNQTAYQRVRPTNNARRMPQKKTTGWFGLPSLRDMQF